MKFKTFNTRVNKGQTRSDCADSRVWIVEERYCFLAELGAQLTPEVTSYRDLANGAVSLKDYDLCTLSTLTS
jgi:hypothetical protein